MLQWLTLTRLTLYAAISDSVQRRFCPCCSSLIIYGENTTTRLRPSKKRRKGYTFAARETVSRCTVCSSVVRTAAGPGPRARPSVGASSVAPTGIRSPTGASFLGASAEPNGGSTQPLTPAAPKTARNPNSSSPTAESDAGPANTRTSRRSSQKK